MRKLLREGYDQQQIVEWRKDGRQRQGLGATFKLDS